MLKAVAAIAFSLFAFTSAVAHEATLYTLPDVELSITARVDQPTIAFMGDGLAAERARLAARTEQALAPVDPDRMARFEADVLEPTETGSLGLAAWEAEEPSLVNAYFEGRAAYESMLTP
jgi:hypothetical protein